MMDTSFTSLVEYGEKSEIVLAINTQSYIDGKLVCMSAQSQTERC